MIPAEAVEAASNLPGAAILAAESAVFDAMIEHGPDGRTDGHDKLARAALEAAAPYMTGRSEWHDAVSDAYVDGALSAEQAKSMWARNPYKQ